MNTGLAAVSTKLADRGHEMHCIQPKAFIKMNKKNVPQIDQSRATTTATNRSTTERSFGINSLKMKHTIAESKIGKTQ